MWQLFQDQEIFFPDLDDAFYYVTGYGIRNRSAEFKLLWRGSGVKYKVVGVSFIASRDAVDFSALRLREFLPVSGLVQDNNRFRDDS